MRCTVIGWPSITSVKVPCGARILPARGLARREDVHVVTARDQPRGEPLGEAGRAVDVRA